MKTMIYDYQIVPSIMTVKEYIVPFMVEDPATNASTLVTNNLPFPVAANAVALNLLNEDKINLASKFSKFYLFIYLFRF